MKLFKSSQKTFPALLSVFLVLIAFSGGYFIGDARATQNLVPEGEGRVVGKGNMPDHLKDNVDFSQFWNVWNFVKESYYKQPVSDKELYYGAIKGAVSGLGDPYSVYFDPEEAQQFSDNLEGAFSGIGAEIGIREEKLVIVAPLPDSPAQNAGLMPGDWILQIDGADTTDMSVEKAVSLIRGEKGTEVKLIISRNGLETATEVVVVRDKIVIESVKWKLDEQKIMRISISTFNHETPALFSQVVQEILTSDVEGIILDLRSNPGGLLTTAIDVASAWVGYQPVVIERTKDDARTFNGVMAPRLDRIKTVVLVNGGSASASEIVSGALQDYGLATIVGTQTFGKGSVQDYRELEDGSAVKVTTAAWYTPKGRTIDQTGIAPDELVEYSVEQFKQGIDPQLGRAIDLVVNN